MRKLPPEPSWHEGPSSKEMVEVLRSKMTMTSKRFLASLCAFLVGFQNLTGQTGAKQIADAIDTELAKGNWVVSIFRAFATWT